MYIHIQMWDIAEIKLKSVDFKVNGIPFDNSDNDNSRARVYI